MNRFQMLLAAFAVTLVSVSCTPTTTPASTTTSEVAVSSTSTSSSTTTTTTSPVPILVDANGVELGVPVQDGVFYNPILKRNIAYGFGVLGQYPRDAQSNQVSFYYSDNNCTGTIYLKYKNVVERPALYPSLVFTWVHTHGDNFYIVPDGAVIEKVQVRSQITLGYGCGSVDSATPPQDVYPLTRVDLPFATPLAVPLHYK